MQQKTDSLILNALQPADWQMLLSLGHPHSYQKGEVIFSRGDEGSWLLLIEEGLVEISMLALNGRKSVINHLQRGDILGEIAVFDQAGRSADALALSTVSGIIIHRKQVLEALKKNTDACFKIIETLCDRVRNASEMFETQSLTSASARLARCLLRVAKKWGQETEQGAIHIEQPFSQSDLGELAGLARENVNRHLQSWVQQQLITFEKGDITLIEPDQLSDLAEL